MDEASALLAQLRDIHSPDVSQIPAPGWWFVLLLVLLAGLLILALFRWRERRFWIHQAQRELMHIRSRSEDAPVSVSLAQVSRLARRILLVSYPRAEVAGLQGEDWLKALDAICGRELFTHGYGQILLDEQYRREPRIKHSDLQGLFDVMAELITAAGKRAGRQ